MNNPRSTIKKVFWIGYASYAFDFVFILRELIVSLVPGNSGEKAYLIYYITLNAIVISSAFLYLPIVISIRKFTHLASAKLNNPQRFVLWQLVVVAAEKTIWLPFYFGFFTHYVLNDWPLLDKIYVCKVIDSAFMMVVVKLTYLGCNRRNLQTILAAFGPKNILKKLKFWDHRSGQVHPQVPAVVAQIYTTNA
ncbi:hypothetical protein L5515_003239 [Caenorhabditis briggsae]|uniref:Serpentine receptor class gamma n=1 Tax=Caenorhabditis briggsae TaxID=6238 RepID=A0AAE9EHT3_CAEBR|nr:hypothetical protein L5515_003239 [Caenorhabditis briggsae]